MGTLREHPGRLDRVEVVVGGAGAEDRLQDHLSLELQGGRNDQLLCLQTDTLAVVVNGAADLDEHLLNRGLGQVGGRGQLVAVRLTVGDRVGGVHQGDTVTADVAGGKRKVQQVRAQGLLGLNHGLSQVLGEGRADTDVIAVFHQNLGQGVSQAIDLVDKTGDVQRTALVIRDGGSVRHSRGRVHTEEHYLFVVVTGDTLDLLDKAFPLVVALLINTIKDFVDNRFDYRTKVCTTHWGCHLLVPFFRY